jgi:hypothetical protein
VIDGDYELVAPGFDVDQLIEKAAPILLAPAARGPA